MDKSLIEEFKQFAAERSGGGSPIETINKEPISSPVRVVDPDTVNIGGQLYRLQGFNMPETAKLQGGIFVPGQSNMPDDEAVVNEVARLGGYTNLETAGKDPYGRIVAKQTNKLGQNLGDTLTMLGIAKPNLYSSDQAISDAATLQAVSTLIPSLGGSDPLISLARRRQEEEIARAGGNPLYVPKELALDEQQYAGIKSAVGIPAVKEHIEEIARLENILATEDLSLSKRQDLHNKLEKERQNLYLAASTPDPVSGVLLRSSDRSIMNKAYDQFGTSFRRAYLDMFKGLGGILEMTGETNQWEYLKEKGKEIQRRNNAEANSLADTLSSFKDINTNDVWSTITDSATYVTNLFAGTLPHMALIGASMAAAAPLAPVIGTAGAATLSAIPGSLSYAGGIYADQPDDKKNVELAMAMGITAGVLDRLGMEGLFAGGNLFTLVGRKELTEQLIQAGKAASRKEAEQILEAATKKELVELSTTGAQFAKQQYASSQALLRSSAFLLGKAGGEAGTETIQTIAEAVGIYGEWNTDAQYEKGFYESLIDSAVGGGAMGGAIGMTGAAIDAAQWQSAADALAMYQKGLQDAQTFNMEQLNRAAAGDHSLDKPAVTSTIEAARFAKSAPANEAPAKLHELPALKGAWNGFKSVVTDPVRLFRSLANTAIPDITKEDGSFRTNLAYLKSIMGGFGILPGDNYSGFKQRLVGMWSGNTAEELATNLKTNVSNANSKVRDAWLKHWSKNERLPETTPENIELQAWKDGIDSITMKMKDIADKFGVNSDELIAENPLFEAASIEPKMFMRNKERVIQSMIDAGANRRLASQAADNLVSGNPEKAFAARRFMSQHGVFKDPNLADIFESNVFNSMENLKQDLAGRVAHQVFLGEDGQVLANLLQRAKAAGEFSSDHEYMDTVKNVRDWYDIVNGRYNSIDKYPFLDKVVGWGSTLMMLASLGKAAISSAPEVATSTLGTNGDKVKDQLGSMAKLMLREYRADFNRGTSWVTSRMGLDVARSIAHPGIIRKIDSLQKEFDALQAENASQEKLQELEDKILKLHKEDLGRSLFERLGYNETGYNTQARFELPAANMRKTMQAFASIIGLRALTDSTRIAAITVGSDIITSKVTNLQLIPKQDRIRVISTGQGLTNSQYQDLLELQQWGMNVPQVLAALDDLNGADIESVFDKDILVNGNFPEGSTGRVLQDNLMTTLGNMVDSKIVNPQAFNLPKYYHDPRFRIFTVMTRFVAALHANILPRLYKQYILNGNTGMRYQAFTVIAGALVLAHLANLLKDELSYETGESPYIRTASQKAQRALYGSGLTGRFEQVIDAAMPLYPNWKPNPTEQPVKWAYESVKDASPVITWGDRVVKSMYNFAEGNEAKGVNYATKAMPLIGSFPYMQKEIAQPFKE